jgi:hypothetical protein
MSAPTLTPQPDLAAVKARQQQTWASADYGAVAARIVLLAERLVDAADLHAASAYWTWPPAPATPPWPRPATAVRSPASTTSRHCWSAGGRGRRPRACR